MNINLKLLALQNNYYRRVIYTGIVQVVLMSLLPNQEIGLEKHDDTDQMLTIVSGNGVGSIGFKNIELYSDSTMIVPKGIYHNVVNTGTFPLKLYTIYSRPEHEYDEAQPYKTDYH